MADAEEPKIKTCPNCGAVVPSGAKQCPVCGQLLSTDRFGWMKELKPLEVFLLILGSIMLLVALVAL